MIGKTVPKTGALPGCATPRRPRCLHLLDFNCKRKNAISCKFLQTPTKITELLPKWVAALFFCFATVTANADTLSELKEIQREGHYYYRVAQLANPSTVKLAFKVLPPNSLASCSHSVAIKVKLLRERLPHVVPIVAVYNVKDGDESSRHTVVLVAKQDGGFYMMNNVTKRLDEVSDLTFMYQRDFMPYEKALNMYGSLS